MLLTATTRPIICDDAKTVDQDNNGTDVADVVAVSPDGTDTVSATGVLSDTNWSPIPFDRFGQPFNIHVRPTQQCDNWQYTRVYFEIQGVFKFRIRIGNVYVTDWVSSKMSSARLIS